jgi:hypothetical protein
MVTRSPSFPEAIDALIKLIGSELNCVAVGTIESYEHDKQRAKVKVSLKKPIRNEDGTETEAESVPVIPNVPVLTLGGGGYFAHFPLQQGDQVLVLYADRSLDMWKEKGGEVDPAFTHTHEVTDAIAIPGVRAWSEALSGTNANNLVIGSEDDPSLRIVFDGTNILLSENAAQFVALANKVLTELQKITTYLSALDAVFGAGVSEAGMGAPSALALALKAASLAAGGVPSMQSVAASKVKAE